MQFFEGEISIIFFRTDSTLFDASGITLDADTMLPLESRANGRIAISMEGAIYDAGDSVCLLNDDFNIDVEKEAVIPLDL